MYKLYGVKKWGSLGPQCILEEVGAPYEMVWLSAEDRRGAYRKINPLGYVPSLQLADGRFVFESSAIVTHITDAHPSALAPRPGTPKVSAMATLPSAGNTVRMRRAMAPA